MRINYIGMRILIKLFFYAVWLIPAAIIICVIENDCLKMIGVQIDIKAPTDILIFYSGIGATIAGIILATVTLVFTLNNQVRFASFKANGWLNLFINFCFSNSLVFVLCSLCGIMGLYGLLPLKYSTYLFVIGLWGLPIIGFITRNLLTDTTNTNSAVEGYLEQISCQLNHIAHAVSARESTNDK